MPESASIDQTNELEALASRTDVTLRAPRDDDGARVWDLVAACPPLDQNSLYMNLIQCTHFADTCIIAERGEAVVGWVSGHRPPNDPSAVFVWQVAVGEDGRGQGLAKRMLRALLARPAVADARRLLTTITPGNTASWALFRSLARDLDAPIEQAPWFDRERHFAGRHETEHLVVIGPFASRAALDLA